LITNVLVDYIYDDHSLTQVVGAYSVNVDVKNQINDLIHSMIQSK